MPPLRWYDRAMLAVALLLEVAVLVFLLTSCAVTGSHNRHGGYVDACGDLPPVYGDDC